jgi:hypothetical protein
MSGASRSRSSTLEYLKRNAPPVNAELPPRASLGAVSIMATDAPASCADSAALAAALPAPITRTSTLPSSTGVIRRLPNSAAASLPWRLTSEQSVECCRHTGVPSQRG